MSKETGSRTKSRVRQPIPQGVRFDVFRRDNYTCVYCGRSSPDVTLHCDHVVAHSKGGSDDPSNLVTACSDCNYGKGAKTITMRTTKMTPAVVASDAGLVGLYGHTRDEEGRINWQFLIKGKVTEDLYTIQLFSWLDGRPTDVKMISVANLAECSLYSTADEWTWAWCKEQARQDGRGDRWARGSFYMSTGREHGGAA